MLDRLPSVDMTGSQADFVTRLKTVLPNGWFAGSTPVLDGVLNGIAWALSFVYSMASYARLQTRITTATDAFLDLISLDFFGASLTRVQNEQDAAFRTRVLANLFLEKGTRNGLIRTLKLLTGRIPWVFEPQRPLDTGAYGKNIFGYGVAGGYGSLEMPYQAFVVAYRPTGQGIPNVIGYGNTFGGYNTASQIEYANQSMIIGAVTDASIYSAISAVKPEGSTVWARIAS